MNKIYKKSFLVFLLMSAVIITFLVAINYYLDGGYQFYRADNFESKLTSELINQRTVLVCNNFNDRRVKKMLLSKLTVKPDVLVLGSSRTMGIRNEFFGASTFFNASVTSATLEDDIAMFYLYHQHGWKPAVVLLGIDPWLIENSGKTLWKSAYITEYSNAQHDLLNMRTQPSIYQTLSVMLEKTVALLSPYYFRDTLRHTMIQRQFPFLAARNDDMIENASLEQITSHPGCNLYLPDGPRLPTIIDEQTPAAQTNYMGAVEAHKLMTMEIQEQKRQLFEAIINYLVKNDIQVIFYLPPYQPAAYAEINRTPNNIMIHKIETYFRHIAAKYHIKVIGSYDPVALNLDASDFVDDLHLKSRGIGKIFIHMDHGYRA